MGATDLIPVLGEIDLRSFRMLNNRFTRNLTFWEHLLEAVNQWINHILPIRKQSDHFTMPFSIELEDLRLIAYEIAKSSGKLVPKAKLISQLEASLMGNPEDVFEVDDRKYTLIILPHNLMHLTAIRSASGSR